MGDTLAAWQRTARGVPAQAVAGLEAGVVALAYRGNEHRGLQSVSV